MNNVPIKLDYSKTINEQLPTFDYYKDRYTQYELQIINLQQENEELHRRIDNAIRLELELSYLSDTPPNEILLKMLKGEK